MDGSDIIAKGKGYLELEAKAIELTGQHLGASFESAIHLIESCVNSRKKLVFSGLEKMNRSAKKYGLRSTVRV